MTVDPQTVGCNGCGGTSFYETWADGYEISVCDCGIAQSVRPEGPALVGATEVELVGELARRGRLFLEQPGPDLDTTLADHDERIRAAESALVALQDWARRARAALQEAAHAVESVEYRDIRDSGPLWASVRRGVVLGPHIQPADIPGLQVRLDELLREST